MAEHREEPHKTWGLLNGGPGESTHRFVRWALARGPWLWFAALALAVPSGIAMVHLYLNLTSEIEELLPRNAASVSAVDELRQRLPGLSTLGANSFVAFAAIVAGAIAAFKYQMWRLERMG